MKRFLVFPLVLGIAGALFCPAYYVESVIAQWPAYIFPYGASSWEKIAYYLLPVAVYGAVVGVSTGFVFASWDLIRNRREQTSANRLIPNIFWCACYVIFFATANRAFAEMSLNFSNPNANIGILTLNTLIKMLWWVSTLFINFAALIWATIRSITTDDILTPRVLRDKLRQRARLP